MEQNKKQAAQKTQQQQYYQQQPQQQSQQQPQQQMGYPYVAAPYPFMPPYGFAPMPGQIPMDPAQYQQQMPMFAPMGYYIPYTSELQNQEELDQEGEEEEEENVEENQERNEEEIAEKPEDAHAELQEHVQEIQETPKSTPYDQQITPPQENLNDKIDDARLEDYVDPTTVDFMFPGSVGLFELLDKEIFIELTDGKKIIGVLSSYDNFSNLVIDNATERMVIDKFYGDIPYGDGLLIVRGENTAFLGEYSRERENELKKKGIMIEKPENEILELQKKQKEKEFAEKEKETKQ